VAKTAISEPTNDGKVAIETDIPYVAHIKIVGSADLLLHAWSCESVEAKGKAKKGSEAKKSDDLESYVRRDEEGLICLPAEYVRMSAINAAKFRQDPRSPRKSAMDLFKAAIVVTSPLASLGVAEWDYLDKRRVLIQRPGINRVRPAMRAGWRATFDLLVMLPEYVDRVTLRETIESAGRLIGVGDFRPTFGRFGIVEFK
jgi:hypothetical protein